MRFDAIARAPLFINMSRRACDPRHRALHAAGEHAEELQVLPARGAERKEDQHVEDHLRERRQRRIVGVAVEHQKVHQALPEEKCAPREQRRDDTAAHPAVVRLDVRRLDLTVNESHPDLVPLLVTPMR